MRKSLTAMLMTLATAGFLSIGPTATPVQAQQVEVSVSLFHEELAPYGRWFQHPRWGWVWFPTAIDQTWRPYSRGQWVWTEEHGWYWQSEEPFGWAVYHYGRWAYDEYYGWIWMPSDTWGPGWVSFRYSDSYIGWAPLPPDTLYANYGFDPAYTDMNASYYWPRWVFIPRRFFVSPRVYAYAVAPTRNYFFIRQTTNVTNYVTVNRFIVNRSIEPRRIETAIGRRIAPARINMVADPRRVAARRDRVGEINVFRPTVRIPRGAAAPPPPEAARVRPTDRPRVPVQRNRTAPSERRDAGPAIPPTSVTPRVTTPTPQPPAGPTPPARVTPRTTPPSVTTPPAQPRVTTPSPQPPAGPTPPARVTPRTTPPSVTTPPAQPRVTTPTPQPPAGPTPPARVTPRTTPPSVTTPPAQPRVTTPPARPRVTTPPPQPPARPTPPARTTPPAPGGQQPPCGGPGQPACPPR